MSSFPGRDSLERRVVLFVMDTPLKELTDTSTGTPKILLHQKHLGQYPYSFRGEFALPGKIDSQSLAAIVVTNVDLLDLKALAQNTTVPLILFQPILPTAQVQEELIAKYNLYAVGDFPIDDLLKNAVADQERVRQYLSFLGQKSSFLKTLSPPRFKSAVEKARRLFEKVAEREAKAGAMQTVITPFKQLIEGFALYHHQNEITRKGYGVELAQRADFFLDTVEDLPPGATYLLGEGEGTEDPMVQSRKSTSTFDFNALRQVFARGSFSSQQIANQLYFDADYVSRITGRGWNDSEKKTSDKQDFDWEIRTRRILTPLHLAEHGSSRNTSLLAIEYVPGVPLNDMLELLNNAAVERNNAHRVASDRLRRALIRKMVRDTAVWVKKMPPVQYLPRPSEQEVVDGYRSRIEEFPRLLSRYSCVDFTTEDLDTWKEVSGKETSCVFNMLRFPTPFSSSIVRTRDSSLGNAVIRIDQPHRLKHYVTVFAKRGAVDNQAVADRFYNVDFGVRYGHVLEDIAHILASEEFHSYHEKSKNKAVFDAGVKKEFLASRDEYFRVLDSSNPSARDDFGLMLMVLYRSLRKFNLSTGYWIRLSHEYEHGRVEEKSFVRRQRRIIRQMRHYSALAQEIISAEIQPHVQAKHTKQDREVMTTLGAHMNERFRNIGSVIYHGDYKSASPFVQASVQLMLMYEVLRKIDTSFMMAEREGYSPLKKPGDVV